MAFMTQGGWRATRRAFLAGLMAFVVSGGANAPLPGADPLPSWNDGANKQAILMMTGSGPRLALIVHHDDAEREFACDRQSKVGKLDKARDDAIACGWNVVSMTQDWRRAFPTPGR
jgi:hypothetical protein